MKPALNTLLIGGVIFPILWLIWFIIRFSVDIPYWDEWELPAFLFQPWNESGSSLSLLFAQWGEHRTFFPKLIFVLLASLKLWTTSNLIALNFSFSIISFVLIGYLATQDRPLKFQLFPLAVTSALMFSTVQYTNWLMGYQLTWFLISTLFILAVVILHRQSSYLSPAKLLGSALFCGIISFSSSHGLISWLALFPSVVLLSWGTAQKIRNPCIWLVLTVAVWVGYFTNYETVTGRPKLSVLIENPWVIPEYFFASLGASFSFKISQAIELGILGFILFSLILIFIVRFLMHGASLSRIYSLLPWFSLVLFSLGINTITTFGRSSIHIEQALSPRYTLFTLLFWVALAQMSWILLTSSQFFKTSPSKLLHQVYGWVSWRSSLEHITRGQALRFMGFLMVLLFIFSTGSRILNPEKLYRSFSPLIPLNSKLKKKPITGTGFERNADAYSTLSQAPAKIKRYGSWLRTEKTTGQAVSLWYPATPSFTILVAGYPNVGGNALFLEIKHQEGKVTKQKIQLTNPRERWLPHQIQLDLQKMPQIQSFRLVAIDNSTGSWLGLSEPFQTKTQSFFSLFIQLILILGIALGFSIFLEFLIKFPFKTSQKDFKWGPVFLYGILVCGFASHYLDNQNRILNRTQWRYQKLVWGKSCLGFSRLIRDSYCLRELYPSPEQLVERAEYLQASGILDLFIPVPSTPHQVQGAIEYPDQEIIFPSQFPISVEGWVPARQLTPILVWKSLDSTEVQYLAVARPKRASPLAGFPFPSQLRWEAHLSQRPRKQGTLYALGYDPKLRQWYTLKNALDYQAVRE